MAFTTLHLTTDASQASVSPINQPLTLADLLHSVMVSIGHRHRDVLPFLDNHTLGYVETEVRHSNNRDSLATFTGNKIQVGTERLHQITVYTAHPAFTRLPPDRRAMALTAALTHEVTHLAAHVLGIEDTTGPGNRRHTEAFAEIAAVLGLQIKRQNDAVGIYTTGLSTRGVDRMGEVIEYLAERLPMVPAPATVDRVGPHRLMRRVLPWIPAKDSATHINLICQCRLHNGYPAVLQVARTYRNRVEACAACGSRFLDLYRLTTHDEHHYVQ